MKWIWVIICISCHIDSIAFYSKHFMPTISKSRLLCKNDINRIRNFCIIAHIDHGKSTLADRLLEATNTITAREMQAQVLDNMEIERERGITIKLQAVRMKYQAEDGIEYILNLIDTPGHVDFGYEVSRSLAACEGALLVVDASQGVEAQTIANVHLAIDSNLEIIPVLNKIDLSTADPLKVLSELELGVGLNCNSAVLVSAKTGEGIHDVLEAIVKALPAPIDTEPLVTRLLVFDSYHDPFRGVVVMFRVVNGSIKRGDKIRFMKSKSEYEVLELGVMSPQQVKVDRLHAGEVGYLSAGIKSVEEARVGDTITLKQDFDCNNSMTPLAGYAPAKPMVYAGLYPSNPDDYDNLRTAIEKLRLNDASFTFQPESSVAMGHGFRCGFLGLLHMDIIQERLEREFDVDIVVTAPSVVYRVVLKKPHHQIYRKVEDDINDELDEYANEKEEDTDFVSIDSPAKLPAAGSYSRILEPYVRLEISTPPEFVGALMELCQSRRGEYKDTICFSDKRTSIIYEIPLAEVITDLFDAIKSKSRGYGSMSFCDSGYRVSNLVKLDFRVHHEEIPPLAMIVPQESSYSIGKEICEKLKELIPRQQFKIPIQACINSKVIASTMIGATYKDVLAKCYGGDITRKKKLLAKQAKGKKRMRAIGKVSIPQDAFMSIIRRGDSGGGSGSSNGG